MKKELIALYYTSRRLMHARSTGVGNFIFGLLRQRYPVFFFGNVAGLFSWYTNGFLKHCGTIDGSSGVFNGIHINDCWVCFLEHIDLAGIATGSTSLLFRPSFT